MVSTRGQNAAGRISTKKAPVATATSAETAGGGRVGGGNGSIGARLRRKRSQPVAETADNARRNKRPRRKSPRPEPERNSLLSEQTSKVDDGATHQTLAQGLTEPPVLISRFAQDPAHEHSATIEQVLEYCARLKELDDDFGSGVDRRDLPTEGATAQLKIKALPHLDEFASQILKVLAMTTFDYLTAMLANPESEKGKLYVELLNNFRRVKIIYATKDSFLSPTDNGLDENGINILRKANVATFVASVFGSRDVGFYHLNEHFLDVFVADGNRILKQQAQLLLELKTQTYISAISHQQRSRSDILKDLFPVDIEQKLLKRRPGTKALAPSEVDFVQRVENRRKALSEEPDNPTATASLRQKYDWDEFLRHMSAHISKHFNSIVGKPPSGVHSLNDGPEDEDSVQSTPGAKRSYDIVDEPAQLTQHPRPQHPPGFYPPPPGFSPQDVMQSIEDGGEAMMGAEVDDIAAKANQAAFFAMQGFAPSGVMPQGPTLNPSYPPPPMASYTNSPYSQPPSTSKMAPPPPANGFHPPQNQFMQFQQPPQQAPQPLAFVAPNANNAYPHGFPPPPPGHAWTNSQESAPITPTANSHSGQSHPTYTLYEMARQASNAKSAPQARDRSGTPSQRRPWSGEEERALMEGLDAVQGPHWSGILALHGPGGKLSEILKDRNQVQLKDKARNLKLWFLKSGKQVPPALQLVTGELKTRAPGQAAARGDAAMMMGDNNTAAVPGPGGCFNAPMVPTAMMGEFGGPGGGAPAPHPPTLLPNKVVTDDGGMGAVDDRSAIAAQQALLPNRNGNPDNVALDPEMMAQSRRLSETLANDAAASAARAIAALSRDKAGGTPVDARRREQ